MVIFQFVMLVYQRVQRRIKSVRSSYNVASSRCASSRDCLSRQLNMNVIMFHSTHTPLPCSTPCATRHQLRMKITNENWQKQRDRDCFQELRKKKQLCFAPSPQSIAQKKSWMLCAPISSRITTIIRPLLWQG